MNVINNYSIMLNNKLLKLFCANRDKNVPAFAANDATFFSTLLSAVTVVFPMLNRG